LTNVNPLRYTKIGNRILVKGVAKVLTMTQTNLRSWRESLKEPKVTQEDIARLADVRLYTFQKAENGKRISFTTAKAIHTAVNTICKDRGIPEKDIFDLGLNIV